MAAMTTLESQLAATVEEDKVPHTVVFAEKVDGTFHLYLLLK
jgi:hypothetical protein